MFRRLLGLGPLLGELGLLRARRRGALPRGLLSLVLARGRRELALDEGLGLGLGGLGRRGLGGLGSFRFFFCLGLLLFFQSGLLRLQIIELVVC